MCPERELSDRSVSLNFMRKIDKHLKYLTALKSASVKMQTNLATLEYCQFQCNAIAKLAEEGRCVPGHDFEHCKIESSKFSVGNSYDSDATFIRAIIKVQQGDEDNLMEDEASVIEQWKLNEFEEDSSRREKVLLDKGTLSQFEAMNQEREQNKRRKTNEVWK